MATVPPSPPPSLTAAIAIGSNLGDRDRHIAGAISDLAKLPNSHLLARGPIVQSAPIGLGGIPGTGGPYLNTAILLATTLPPEDLLDQLHAIERSHGRNRDAEPEPCSPRTLDLDLLLYGDLILNTARLTVPHPRMHERLFVLEPLAPIASDMRIPTLGKTVGELLRALRSSRGFTTPHLAEAEP